MISQFRGKIKDIEAASETVISGSEIVNTHINSKGGVSGKKSITSQLTTQPDCENNIEKK